jgi:hypothetical protein
MHYMGKEAIKISDTPCTTIQEPIDRLYLSLGSSCAFCDRHLNI